MMNTLNRQTRIIQVASFFVCILMLNTGLALGKQQHEGALLENFHKGFTNVVKKVNPSVVHIKIEKTVKGGSILQDNNEFFNDPFFKRFFGPQFRRQQPDKSPRQFKRKQSGMGSGFLISKDGYILTNNHVVDDADEITVIMANKKEFKAKVIGTDPMSDVALLKIKDGGNLPFLTLGDSDKLEVGEWVIAIGNPFGLSQTVTVGVVSAKGRSRVGINEYENFIQTDAAINPGNSGGPLLNTQGEVIGINSALFSRTGGYMGIGFAIPINMVKAIQDQLHEHGKVTRGWLGVIIQDIDKDLALSFGLKEPRGILVSEVQKDSPADKALLRRGDVIIQLNDINLIDVADLRNRVALLPPKSKVILRIIRESKEQEIEVIIGERPAEIDKMATPTDEKSSLDQFGLTFQDLTEELAEQFGFTGKEGVLIAEVEPDSPAALAGLKPGILIEEVDRQPISSIKELLKIVKMAQNPKRLLLRVNNKGFSHYVVLIAE